MRHQLKEARSRLATVTARNEKRGRDIERALVAVQAGGDPAALIALEAAQARDQETLAALQREVAELEAAKALEAALAGVQTLAGEALATKAAYDAKLVEGQEVLTPIAAELATLEATMGRQQQEALGLIRQAYRIDLRTADSPEQRQVVARVESALRDRGVDLSALFQRFPHSQRGFVLDQPYRLPALTPTGALVLRAVEIEHVGRAGQAAGSAA